ncbi:hypothetical protein A2661_01605 [Candidatus Giovannonibacteria bacterium RIFCSPHIGHO2_01_FULL_45_24]|uniref:glucose-6-phosphate isomerase n=1 Tax=Candidatus Giovannonibacteria bacterium RIFCSPLOWO2_01_FULL_46_32 TaxID=1798353 RepID=A0A1F5XH75_9BACT|nr:MAG: hypothetical protein A2661_01605 [Candidatus Giovannonibacteria bacterium RIFCSPHIGHO2_01_FULL_45_24]OGF87263.1 MAG: hypothetical protein A3B19_03480 [Candidatus Giovannonibacteria bacterium RIFCSPLOWO2_01_FULL_46_32]
MSGKYLLNSARSPDVSKRMVFDMKPVFRNPEAVGKNGVFYEVYRNLEIVGGKARYDITEIPQQKIGGEFAKTFGHYHRGPQSDLYEVLEGYAYFLIQRYENNPADIKEAYIIEAMTGDKIVTPPNFGHLAVNVGEKDLVLANWVSLVEYDYETIKKLRGGCYYVIDARLDSRLDSTRLTARQAGEAIEFEKNPNYKSVPELKKLKLKDVPELGIKNGAQYPILNLKNSPEKLDWLAHPEKYQELLTIKNLYQEI